MVPPSTVVVPYGLRLRETPEGTVISRPWFILATVPIALFTVAWDISMFFLYRSLFRTPNPSWPLWLFSTGHLALGLALTYGSLAMFLNRTEIWISPTSLRVSRGPLPWFGNFSLSKGEVRTVTALPEHGDGDAITGYHVVCVDRSQKKRVLLRALSTPEQTDFVLAAVCQRLGFPGPMP